MFKFSKGLYGFANFTVRLSVTAVWLAALAFTGCTKKDNSSLSENFNSLSTDSKMEQLMEKLPPDSVAVFICDAALGKRYNSRIELEDALNYAYSNYGEADLVIFDEAVTRYGETLPLHEKVRFYKLANQVDADIYGYEIGLRYVGTIREEGKDVKQVKEEVDRLIKECKADPETYKRFIKGFKQALQYDRGKDLDDKIYTQFISYPDSIR